MYHDLPGDATFWSFLLAIDQDLAEEARKKGCPCGGHLHCAHYPRKHRGVRQREQSRILGLFFIFLAPVYACAC
jgi:hypothetical protein